MCQRVQVSAFLKVIFIDSKRVQRETYFAHALIFILFFCNFFIFFVQPFFYDFFHIITDFISHTGQARLSTSSYDAGGSYQPIENMQGYYGGQQQPPQPPPGGGYAEYPHRPPTPPSPSDRSSSPPPQHREPGM